jgi:hypothetical protein
MQNKFVYIPARNKIGAIIRTTDSVDRFSVIESAVDNLLNINEISLIFIMIYKPEDDSQLRKKLIEKYGKEKKRIEFMYVDSGNFHNDLLNYAIKEQTRRGIDYSLSVSPEAFEYITKENLAKIFNSIKNGALAVGLKIFEYKDIINQGYFSNAFAIYRNAAINFVDIWDIKNIFASEDMQENNFGMEELYAIKRLLEVYGVGSVEILTPENGKMTYSADIKSTDWREKVQKTKQERFEKMLSMLKLDPEDLKKKIVWN